MKLSATLHHLREESKVRVLTVQSLLDALSDKGHSVLIAVFTIPFLQPLPTFGLSAPFGLIICIIGFCMMVGAHPWVPARFRQLEMKSEVATKSIEVAETIFSKIERLIRPRFELMTQFSVFRSMTGFLIMVHGFLMALPLPIPGTNSAPAWTLLVLALSQIEEDGYLVVLGYLMSVGVFAFFALLVFLPYYGINLLQHTP